MISLPADGASGRTRWYLESLIEGGSRIPILPLPFKVGRSGRGGRGGPVELLGLSLDDVDSVSKEHAELFLRGNELWVRDLDSRNGTFVNGQRVTEIALREGDLLVFASKEFRLVRRELAPEELAELDPPTKARTRDLAWVFALPKLIEERQVTVVFQAIVDLPNGTLTGYEAFGRGTRPGLPEAPLELFRLAEEIEKEAELSRLFRERAVEIVEQRPRFPLLFLNVHAAELGNEGLAASFVATRRKRPDLRLALELHERALEDLEAVERLRAALSRAGVGLAYDGFGAGEARLLELAEVRPQYLKFDSQFVSGIDSAPSRQRLLSSLLAVARDLLVFTVAEGVETQEEAEVCRRLGFTHGQGFYFGHPKPINQL